VVEKRFIILGYGRTGSTTFRKLLSQHPQVHAYGEVFRRGKRRPPPEANGRRFAPGMDPVAFLNEEVYGSPNEFDKRCIGFKLFHFHGRGDSKTYRLWPHLVESRDLRIIFLTRRNLFDSYVSLKRAKRSGQFGFSELGAPSEAHKASFKVELADCQRYLRTQSAAMARLQVLFGGHQTLQIEHETLFSAPQETLGQAFRFLGEEPIAVEVKDRKLNRVAHKDGITNYAEVVRFFQRSLFEDFFDLSVLPEADLKDCPSRTRSN
jgi:LPS sulfotransferase NodH